jgi:hypothetical protein
MTNKEFFKAVKENLKKTFIYIIFLKISKGGKTNENR